jgi:hypothetical protein
MKKFFILLLIVVVGWEFYNRPDQISLGPGVTVTEVPKQENIESSISYTNDDYTITAIATFRIKAKVLSKENYHDHRA